MSNIAIISNGAIALFYGSKLIQAGHQVTYIIKSNPEQLKAKGFSVISENNKTTFTPHQVIKLGEPSEEKYDLVIVATKVLPEVTPALIKPYVSEQTEILLMQNGILIEPPYQAAFPDNPLLSALSFICAQRTGDNEVTHFDYGRIVIGRYPNGEDDSVKRWVQDFASTGISAKASDNIKLSRWIKLIWNAPFNPLSVIGNHANTQDMLAHAEPLIRTVMQEVQTLAKADGCIIDDTLIEKNISDTRTMVPYKTSMLVDFENKRPLEHQAILGNALTFAHEKGIQVPAIEALYHCLKLISRS